MSDKQMHKLKNFVFITTGTIVSLAGIAYIAVQYSKLLTTLFMKNEDDDVDAKSAQKIKSRFSQLQAEEGSAPDALDDDDIAIDIIDAE